MTWPRCLFLESRPHSHSESAQPTEPFEHSSTARRPATTTFTIHHQSVPIWSFWTTWSNTSPAPPPSPHQRLQGDSRPIPRSRGWERGIGLLAPRGSRRTPPEGGGAGPLRFRAFASTNPAPNPDPIPAPIPADSRAQGSGTALLSILDRAVQERPQRPRQRTDEGPPRLTPRRPGMASRWPLRPGGPASATPRARR